MYQVKEICSVQIQGERAFEVPPPPTSNPPPSKTNLYNGSSTEKYLDPRMRLNNIITLNKGNILEEFNTTIPFKYKK